MCRLKTAESVGKFSSGSQDPCMVFGHVTLRAPNGKDCFGTICLQNMTLSLVGQIIQFALTHRSDPASDAGICIDEWMIMPNHVHLLLLIPFHCQKFCNSAVSQISCGFLDQMTCNHRIKCSSGPVLKRFKRNVKRWTDLYGLDFHWGPGITLQLIGDENDLTRIRWHMRRNPEIWESDILNRKNR